MPHLQVSPTDCPRIVSLHLRSTAVALALLVSSAFPVPAAAAQRQEVSPDRPRVVLLTDYWKDPDEIQAMVRFLSYASEYDIEGLIATSLAFGDGSVHPEWITDILNDYGRVYDSLKAHARQGFPFPTAESLKKVVRPGARMIRTFLGTGKGFPVPYPEGARDSRSCEPVENWLMPGRESAGAELIIQVIDREDPRPVWILVWGGAVDLAQAINKVRRERSPEAAEQFIRKIRLHQSNWQDTGTVWIWNNVPELFFILTNQAKGGLNAECDESLRNDAWLRQHVLEGHGPLAARYPVLTERGHKLAMKEGDAPTFLSLLAPGLSDPEQPEWGGWGGRRERLDPARNFFVDGRDHHPTSVDPRREMYWTLARWAEAISRDFEARLDWCVSPRDGANHPPVAILDGDATTRVLRRTVRSGQEIALDASASSDPDGHALDFAWSHYAEPGSFRGQLTLEHTNTRRATLVAPAVTQPETVHLILAVTDRGAPRLTSYRRTIVTIVPAVATR